MHKGLESWVLRRHCSTSFSGWTKEKGSVQSRKACRLLKIVDEIGTPMDNQARTTKREGGQMGRTRCSQLSPSKEIEVLLPYVLRQSAGNSVSSVHLLSYSNKSAGGDGLEMRL